MNTFPTYLNETPVKLISANLNQLINSGLVGRQGVSKTEHMTRKENHSQADSSPFDPSLEPSSRLLKYVLTRSCNQTNCPARPGSLKGTGQTGTGVYSVPTPGACW